MKLSFVVLTALGFLLFPGFLSAKDATSDSKEPVEEKSQLQEV